MTRLSHIIAKANVGEAARWAGANRLTLATNALAGLVASLVIIAYCVSFSALLFPGALKHGLAFGLWGLLIGSVVAGLFISLTTSLPPVEAGPDNPAVPVLSVLAGSIAGQVYAAGGGTELAAQYVLLSFSLATLVTGLLLFGLGAFKLGQAVRFVPYPVIGGFLGASGWFLVTGGIEVVTGREFSLADVSGSLGRSDLLRIVLSLGLAVTIYAVKRITGSAYILPTAFFGSALLLDIILASLDLMNESSGWFISGSAELKAWSPIAVIVTTPLDWTVFLKAAVEIGAIAAVTVIALLLDVTGLEVARTKSADLDQEFRTNGIANIIAAPLGGMMGNLSLNGSRLLEETGGLARMSGVFASLFVLGVVVTGIDLPSLVPSPVLAGLLIYLGIVVLVEVLLRSPAQRAWMDFGLALLIMLAIVQAGYLVGVILGFIGACLMFAVNYSRIAVIRRHLTRAEFASNVDRSVEAARLLREHGEKIHVFWLSGFIFFGSSNGVFEGLRETIRGTKSGAIRYAVLDFADVSGFDTSALLSLIKLRNHCETHGITLACAGLSSSMRAALEHLQFFGPDHPHKIFEDRNSALEWCEDQVLKGVDETPDVDFENWLAAEIGGKAHAQAIAAYFERRAIKQGHVIYEQGAPSDTIDLVVDGSVAITVKGEPGLALLVRRMSKKTVVGEMGFFRHRLRAATVTAEKNAVIYTLTRRQYERLVEEKPELVARFLEFVARALSDRLDFANQGIAALS